MKTRLVWKTYYMTDHDDFRRIQSAWASSQSAFGKNKVMNFGASELETNISLSGLQTLFTHAGVKLNRNKIVLDSMTLEERVVEWEKEEHPGAKIKSAKNNPSLCGMCGDKGVGYVILPSGSVHLCGRHLNEHIELGYKPATPSGKGSE